MRWWNRKTGGPPGTGPARPQGPPAWRQYLKSRKAVPQLAVLAVLFVAALIVIQLPHPPLPVHKGDKASHPFLARVDFKYQDADTTAAVRQLTALLAVPDFYTPDVRPVTAQRDGLLALVDEAVKAPALEQVPEAARKQWDLGAEAFAAIKKAVGEKAENLIAVREAITKAFAPLEKPASLPIVGKEDVQREADRLDRIKELRDKLPAGLPPEKTPATDKSPAEVRIIVPAGDSPLPVKDLLATQSDAVQAKVKECVEADLKPVLGDAGAAAAVAAMAPRIGPTLVYAKAETENRRADARKDVGAVEVLHKSNTTLIEAGKDITESDLKLLEQEQMQYLADLGWVRAALAWIGAALILGLLIILQAVCTVRLQPNVGRSFPRTLILAVLCLLVLAASKTVAQSQGPVELYTLLLAVAGMTVAVAYTPIFGLALAWSLVLLVAVATRADLDWAITAAIGTSVAILALGQIDNRSKLIKVGALAGLAFFASRMALAFWRVDYPDTSLWTVGQMVFLPSLLYLGVGLAAGILMLAILPSIERAFGIVTNISLLELCDVNHPALRRMALEAPGTYTHSLMIGALAEAAADSIGAGGLLARVGAYFHDIGKAGKPRYFGENWAEGQKIHENLPPATSRQVIMNHVQEGLDMAKRLGLPPIIRQFIAEHHGTTLMDQFYQEARRQAISAGAAPPAESEYRYPGPKPRSRETAVLMLADAVEGAARSLADRTAPRLGAMVHDILLKRLLDGQLDESGLTLANLKTVEETLTQTLLSVYHGRTAYPADRSVGTSGEVGAGSKTDAGTSGS